MKNFVKSSIVFVSLITASSLFCMEQSSLWYRLWGTVASSQLVQHPARSLAAAAEEAAVDFVEVKLVENMHNRVATACLFCSGVSCCFCGPHAANTAGILISYNVLFPKDAQEISQRVFRGLGQVGCEVAVLIPGKVVSMSRQLAAIPQALEMKGQEPEKKQD
ncbi:MAG: hypothetical protein NTX86_01975 [Candidatus Dependentiae bacterium]|nr:hypothetical protein [Candidatus Dependentiae bacterium]